MQSLDIPKGPANTGGYTAEQVLRALRGVDGSRLLTFRYELLDSTNTKIGDLDNVLDCTISQNWLADIKRTAKFTLRADGQIDFLSQRIKPWVRLAMPPTEVPLPFTIRPAWTNRFNGTPGAEITTANSGGSGDNLASVTGTVTYDSAWSTDGQQSALLGGTDTNGDPVEGAFTLTVAPARSEWALRTYLNVPSGARLTIAPDGLTPDPATHIVIDDVGGEYRLGAVDIAAHQTHVIGQPVRLEIENDGTTAAYRLYWANPYGDTPDFTGSEPSTGREPVETVTVTGTGTGSTPPETGHVARLGASTVETSSTTGSITVGSAVPAGETVIGAVAWTNDVTSPPTVTAATDSRGNSYTVDVAAGTGNTTVSEAILRGTIVTPLQAGDTITVTISAARIRWCLTFDHFSHQLDAADPLDQTAANHNPGSATALTTGTTPATSQPDELLYAAFGFGVGRTIGIPAGWTGGPVVETAQASANRALQAIHRTVSATGAQQGTLTIDPAGVYSACIATYAIAAPPAVPVQPPAVDSLTIGDRGPKTEVITGGYVEWPQGVFLLSTPSRSVDASDVVTRAVDGYDQLQIFIDDVVPDRYTAAAGAAYTTVVSSLLGSVAKQVTPSSAVLPVAKEWEPGTTKLAIINELLSAINYDSLSFDEDGVALVRPYVSPQDRPAEYTYADDAVSVMNPEVEQELDLFSVPNRWVLVVSDPDRAALSAVYTNSDPASPTSTVRRQRVITDFRQEEDAADQATLAARAARLAFEASQVFETISFTTALMPVHSGNDVYKILYGPLAVNAKYAEHTWEMELKAGTQMRHQARRVVSISNP
ncbi:hypothetical protein [Actinomadura sp. K4S16]|uniref:hypothetical protein n=1 Tax=Actinomadura sp. K4S16 TaxID=1316147 RepID=UPI0011ED9A50|nr:hypothetical protein [Actinomadura sp. K4S16]